MQNMIQERNRKIRVLMELFSCSYARAAHLYHITLNYSDSQVVIRADGSFEAK